MIPISPHTVKLHHLFVCEIKNYYNSYDIVGVVVIVVVDVVDVFLVVLVLVHVYVIAVDSIPETYL